MKNFELHEFSTDFVDLNIDFLYKLDQVSTFYNREIIDSDSLCKFKELETMPEILSYFTNQINSKLSVLSSQIQIIARSNPGSAQKAESVLVLPKVETIKDEENQSNYSKRDDSKHFKIFEIIKEKRHGKKTESLKYLYKRIRNALNSYIVSEINKILKRHGSQGKILPKNCKLLHQSYVSRPFKNLLELSPIQVMPKNLTLELYNQTTPSQLEPLDSSLNQQIKVFFKNYLISNQYQKDMKLMESQVGTTNLKLLLGDIRKHLNLNV